MAFWYALWATDAVTVTAVVVFLGTLAGECESEYERNSVVFVACRILSDAGLAPYWPLLLLSEKTTVVGPPAQRICMMAVPVFVPVPLGSMAGTVMFEATLLNVQLLLEMTVAATLITCVLPASAEECAQ